MRRDDLMAREWALLENQRKVVEALTLAGDSCYGDDSWCEANLSLRRKVAYELHKTCERIWDLSAKEGERVMGA